MKPLQYIIAFILLLSVSQSRAQSTTVNASVNNVLKGYLGIKNALTTDKTKDANAAAKKFTVTLKEVSTMGMNTDQKATWQKYAEKLRMDGEHIAESTEIAHQREHFGSLSTNMLAVLKAFHANDLVVYQQYCPMAKKSWISESSTIKNPYYGQMMLDCGVTKETFKPLAAK